MGKSLLNLIPFVTRFLGSNCNFTCKIMCIDSAYAPCRFARAVSNTKRHVYFYRRTNKGCKVCKVYYAKTYINITFWMGNPSENFLVRSTKCAIKKEEKRDGKSVK